MIVPESVFLDNLIKKSNKYVSSKQCSSPILSVSTFHPISCGVYISQLIRFARSLNLSDFSCPNEALTAKLLRQGYCYFKLRKAFSKFYRRYSALVEKYNVSLKTHLQQGISEPEFYGDFVYRFRKKCGKI